MIKPKCVPKKIILIVATSLLMLLNSLRLLIKIAGVVFSHPNKICLRDHYEFTLLYSSLESNLRSGGCNPDMTVQYLQLTMPLKMILLKICKQKLKLFSQWMFSLGNYSSFDVCLFLSQEDIANILHQLMQYTYS